MVCDLFSTCSYTALNSIQLGGEKIREEVKQVADDIGDQRRT